MFLRFPPVARLTAQPAAKVTREPHLVNAVWTGVVRDVEKLGQRNREQRANYQENANKGVDVTIFDKAFSGIHEWG